jgi:hypothetical protein
MERNQADARLLKAVADNHRRWFRTRDGENGIWTVDRNDALGVRLVARGYEWGWRPHWMGIDLEREPKPAGDFKVEPAAPPFAKTLPYREEGRLPSEAIHHRRAPAREGDRPGDRPAAGRRRRRLLDEAPEAQKEQLAG